MFEVRCEPAGPEDRSRHWATNFRARAPYGDGRILELVFVDVRVAALSGLRVLLTLARFPGGTLLAL